MVQKQANDYQVGGSHYYSNYQHWDLMAELRADYFAGCITGYVARWRQKGGAQDLRKAKHFAEKYAEVLGTSAWPSRPVIEAALLVAGYAEQNNLPGQEYAIFHMILVNTSPETCRAVAALLETMIQEREKFEEEERRKPKPAAPVPLTEENHYTPRAGAVTYGD